MDVQELVRWQGSTQLRVDLKGGHVSASNKSRLLGWVGGWPWRSFSFVSMPVSVPIPLVCAVVHFQKEKTCPALRDGHHNCPAFHLALGVSWGLEEERAEMALFPSLPPGSRGTPALELSVSAFLQVSYFLFPSLSPALHSCLVLCAGCRASRPAWAPSAREVRGVVWPVLLRASRHLWPHLFRYQSSKAVHFYYYYFFGWEGSVLLF